MKHRYLALLMTSVISFSVSDDTCPHKLAKKTATLRSSLKGYLSNLFYLRYWLKECLDWVMAILGVRCLVLYIPKKMTYRLIYDHMPSTQ